MSADKAARAEVPGLRSDALLPPSVERRVLRVRRHWASLLTYLLLAAGILVGRSALTGLASWLDALLWYVAALVVGRFAWKVLEWWNELFIATDKRLMLVSGIIEKKNYIIPIVNVTDMSFSRPGLGRLLGYGTLRVETAGHIEDLEKIEYLPHPTEVFLVITEVIFGEKKQARSHLLEPPRESRRRRRVRSPLVSEEVSEERNLPQESGERIDDLPHAPTSRDLEHPPRPPLQE